MLAKTPRKTDFSTTLRIPAPPPEIAEADAEWRKAVSEREAGQARHIEASRLLASQVPGQPLRITHSEVEAYGKALQPLFNAEHAAAERRNRVREEYETATAATMTAALLEYRDAIADKLDELETLLSIGCRLHAEAVAARVQLPSKLPGVCTGIIEHGVGMARKILDRAV